MRRSGPWTPLALVAGMLVAALALAPANAHATVVVPLTRAEMVQRSDLVVRAAVLGQRSAWNKEHTQIVTLTTLHVTQYLKGSGATDLVLRQFGGEIHGVHSAIAGDAHLRTGQDVVVFLRGSQEGVVFLTALAQSSYLVLHSPGAAPVVRRDLSQLTFASPSSSGGPMVLTPAATEPVESLDHLLADVASIVRGAP